MYARKNELVNRRWILWPRSRSVIQGTNLELLILYIPYNQKPKSNYVKFLHTLTIMWIYFRSPSFYSSLTWIQLPFHDENWTFSCVAVVNNNVLGEDQATAGSMTVLFILSVQTITMPNAECSRIFLNKDLSQFGRYLIFISGLSYIPLCLYISKIWHWK